MYYFYSRVSSISQSSSRQIENFKTHQGYDTSKVYFDKIQGNVPFLERPQAIKLYDEILGKKNITVVVDSIDRLGRNLLDILNTIEMFKKNSINLKSLKEGFSTLLDNGKSNPTAMLVISVMGSLAEMERNRIKERTKEGITIAKASGKYQGRKLGSIQSDDKLLQKHIAIQKKLERDYTIREISELTGASSATIIKVKRVMEKRNML
jgi:DNA invertase Pin-like site-specific DNA recombinase